MKVLVATHQTQGKRRNDFCHAQDGELVAFPVMECTGEKPDGHCGCARAMSGFESLRSTTTVEVVERDLTRAEYEAALTASFRKGGWATVAAAEWEEALRQNADELLSLADRFPVGAVLERRGAKIARRFDA